MARQERAIRTQLSILKAAAEVFDSHGYEAATIGEILRRAGVTKGALYFHFPSKQALAEGVLEQQFSVIRVPPGPCRLQEFVDTGLIVAYRMRRDPLVSAVARLSLEQELRAEYGSSAIRQWIGASEVLLGAAKEQGELLPHVVPAESAWLFSAAWTGTQLYSQILLGREDLEERVVALFRHLLPSIAVPAVLSSLEITAERAARLGSASDALLEGPGEQADSPQEERTQQAAAAATA
ncbi:gamma-butyrolactone-binding protein [Streptomyces ambofaciens]|uniref:Gamma-butyrolactone-binding protein n=1 Tax=Streptomyces ambofaciens TaxID=1889 RepID=Q0JW81_STRAM|nr:ScbR family autoregulator-binding transcription factor [Streptomyces ambofaciens]ANB04154.1 gamma-butyrolactone-binding protein [Streptomyces ambofaciens]ANB10686.1 gamma-butyrolactone-binding protein [Streptomyces ambofaciens]CAK51048.1 putative gamma-butyrolactone binding protein [Streptomyces ambofaciens]CAK51286.1 putative gamma-butyrolactone binding protein [Streptomyces ambofaciens]